MKNQTTIYACYIGYIVQGIINNISPILFVTYQTELGIPLDRIALLIVVNFGVQILVDFVAAKYADKIGYRILIVAAHVISVIGLLGIGILPMLLPSPMLGLVIATTLNGIGGGLLEVLVSPIVEAVPGEEKEKAMSLLHSFYCWGCVGFVLISTIMLRFLPDEKWFVLPIVWAIVPFINVVLFTKVPIRQLLEDEEESDESVFTQKIFWILVVLMICAGASEQGMSQWASYFAELGLKVDKTMGDILGPCFFSILMGCARTFFGKSEADINLVAFMKGSCVLCVASYMLAVFAPHPVLGLVGCAVCGASVGIMWPGTFSLAAKICRAGGTAMFALLALAGDIGCMSGPQVVSLVSQLLPDYGLKAGLFAAIIFPVVMLSLLLRNGGINEGSSSN